MYSRAIKAAIVLYELANLTRKTDHWILRCGQSRKRQLQRQRPTLPAGGVRKITATSHRISSGTVRCVSVKLLPLINWRKRWVGERCWYSLSNRRGSAWEEDLKCHVDFQGWQFIKPKGLTYEQADKRKPFVCFGSFQDYLWSQSQHRWYQDEERVGPLDELGLCHSG